MKLKLHHVNFATEKVAEMDEFYRGILDIQSEQAMGSGRIKEQGYGGDVAFVSDGDTIYMVVEDPTKAS